MRDISSFQDDRRPKNPENRTSVVVLSTKSDGGAINGYSHGINVKQNPINVKQIPINVDRRVIGVDHGVIKNSVEMPEHPSKWVANPKKTEKTDPMIFRERGEGGAKAAKWRVV